MMVLRCFVIFVTAAIFFCFHITQKKLTAVSFSRVKENGECCGNIREGKFALTDDDHTPQNIGGTCIVLLPDPIRLSPSDMYIVSESDKKYKPFLRKT